LLDGTYHPLSSRPSGVLNETLTYGAPRSPEGVTVRAAWVNPYDSDSGKIPNANTIAAATAIPSRRAYRRTRLSFSFLDLHSVTAPTATSTRPARTATKPV